MTQEQVLELIRSVMLENRGATPAAQQAAGVAEAAAAAASAAVAATAAAKTARKFKMVDPPKFCGGAKDLDNFLSHLRQNFRTHEGQFPGGDEDKVTYALSFMGKWSEHAEPDQRKVKMMDPAHWARELRVSQHPCLKDFDLFEKEVQKVYGDKDRTTNAAIAVFQGYQQASHETVRMFSNRLQSLWREAGWDLENPGTQTVLYDLLWAGFKPYLRTRVKPFAAKLPDGRFGSIDELIDMAADSETSPQQQKTDKKAPDGQSSGNGGSGGNSEGDGRSRSRSRGRKRAFRSSVSESKQGSEQSAKSSQEKKPPAPWVSTEEFQKRKSEGKCVRCAAGGHTGPECKTYGPATRPNQDPGAANNKRAKTAEEQKAKN
jgi:hypothetical protein